MQSLEMILRMKVVYMASGDEEVSSLPMYMPA